MNICREPTRIARVILLVLAVGATGVYVVTVYFRSSAHPVFREIGIFSAMTAPIFFLAARWMRGIEVLYPRKAGVASNVAVGQTRRQT